MLTMNVRGLANPHPFLDAHVCGSPCCGEWSNCRLWSRSGDDCGRNKPRCAKQEKTGARVPGTRWPHFYRIKGACGGFLQFPPGPPVPPPTCIATTSKSWCTSIPRLITPVPRLNWWWA